MAGISGTTVVAGALNETVLGWRRAGHVDWF
jgi:hypothetical protein